MVFERVINAWRRLKNWNEFGTPDDPAQMMNLLLPTAIATDLNDLIGTANKMIRDIGIVHTHLTDLNAAVLILVNAPTAVTLAAQSGRIVQNIAALHLLVRSIEEDLKQAQVQHDSYQDHIARAGMNDGGLNTRATQALAHAKTASHLVHMYAKSALTSQLVFETIKVRIEVGAAQTTIVAQDVAINNDADAVAAKAALDTATAQLVTASAAAKKANYKDTARIHSDNITKLRGKVPDADVAQMNAIAHGGNPTRVAIVQLDAFDATTKRATIVAAQATANTQLTGQHTSLTDALRACQATVTRYAERRNEATPEEALAVEGESVLVPIFNNDNLLIGKGMGFPHLRLEMLTLSGAPTALLHFLEYFTRETFKTYGVILPVAGLAGWAIANTFITNPQRVPQEVKDAIGMNAAAVWLMPIIEAFQKEEGMAEAFTDPRVLLMGAVVVVGAVGFMLDKCKVKWVQNEHARYNIDNPYRHLQTVGNVVAQVGVSSLMSYLVASDTIPGYIDFLGGVDNTAPTPTPTAAIDAANGATIITDGQTNAALMNVFVYRTALVMTGALIVGCFRGGNMAYRREADPEVARGEGQTCENIIVGKVEAYPPGLSLTPNGP